MCSLPYLFFNSLSTIIFNLQKEIPLATRRVAVGFIICLAKFLGS